MIEENANNSLGFRKIMLVTHVEPDLDSCLGTWILKKFIFPNEQCVIRFVSMGEKLPDSETDEADGVFYVDTSGGKYDHHGTNEYVCAASLIMAEHGLKDNPILKRMVSYALLVDHGRVFEGDVSDFDILNVINGMNRLYPDNPGFVVELIWNCFEAIYTSLENSVSAEEEIRQCMTFDTKWGKGCAIESSNKYVRYIAHRRGYVVFVYINPSSGFRGFMAPGDSEVDFSEIYNKIKLMEPEAYWFLHESKQLLLCGSHKAPHKKLSNLSLRELVSVLEDNS